MGRVKNELLPDVAEEGAACPVEDCKGTLVWAEVENCTCHINPPCVAHLECPLECMVCHEQFDAG